MKTQLNRREILGNSRSLQVKPNLVDFASNDYLGLARSRSQRERVVRRWREVGGLGSTGSRLLTGNHLYTQRLEEKIANFHGFEAGLFFSTGFMANMGLVTAIADQSSLFFFDSHVHASIREGIKMSRAKAFPFRHNDLGHLEGRLKLPCVGERYVCIESVYSTDGSVAPLEKIVRLSQKYEAKLIVDEAHAVGVFGPGGRGLVAERGLNRKIFAQVVTFGKALGASGAIVLGDQILMKMLVNFASAFIYSTALPFYCLAAIECSYDVFPSLESNRKQLRDLIKLANFSSSPIQPISVSGNQSAHKKVKNLSAAGFDVRALLSPTVRQGKEILRLCLHSFNSREDLVKLLDIVRSYE
jgi:8-amino-7-oxononanoate synthase